MKPSRALAPSLILLFALALAPAPASATESNPGTIKVHDTTFVDPPQRNQPHVDCEFYIEGFHMADTSGTLVIQVWHPTADPADVLNDTWTGTPETDGKGSHFLNGPYTLPEGHYRVEVFSSTGHPGDSEHFAKAKMFWVEPCETVPPPPVLQCPTDLTAESNSAGTVTLSFTPAPGSNGTNVYRLDADGDWEYLATLPPGVNGYTDTTTRAGYAYTYAVTALYGDRESQECPTVEVSSIPEFPTFVAMGLAAACGVLGYVFVRRKK